MRTVTKDSDFQSEPVTFTCGVKDASERTLKKYGWTIEDWRKQIKAQDGICPICKGRRERMVIDHEHVRGWKKMSDEKRRLYVRGVVCWFCNLYYLCRGMNAQKAENIIRYMRNYQEHFDLGDNPKIADARASYLVNYEEEKAKTAARGAAVDARSAIRSE